MLDVIAHGDVVELRMNRPPANVLSIDMMTELNHALESLGWDGVSDARVGKVVYLDMDAESEDAAREAAEAMCRKFLANPVTEDFEVAVVEGAAAS